MTPFRRVAAALVLLHLLFLFGTGSGLLHAATSRVDCDGMGMETMLSTPAPGHDHAADQPAPDADENAVPLCRLPWAPGGCSAGAACFPVMLGSGTLSRTDVAGLFGTAGAINDQQPLSALRTPEPPPPRS